MITKLNLRQPSVIYCLILELGNIEQQETSLMRSMIHDGGNLAICCSKLKYLTNQKQLVFNLIRYLDPSIYTEHNWRLDSDNLVVMFYDKYGYCDMDDALFEQINRWIYDNVKNKLK